MSNTGSVIETFWDDGATVCVVTCMDRRIDPLAIFNTPVGHLYVLRNAGARVTDDVIRSLTVATNALGVSHIVVLQHDDCAMAKTDFVRSALKDLTVPIDPATIEDYDATLKADVEVLIEHPDITALVQGWRYNPADNTLRAVIGAQ